MDLSNRIRAWRLHAGLKQNGLAERVGVSPSAVCQWEDENPATQTKPSTGRLEAIAAACGVTVGDLLMTMPPKKRARKSTAA